MNPLENLSQINQMASQPAPTNMPMMGGMPSGMPMMGGSKKVNAEDMFIPADTEEGMLAQVQELDDRMAKTNANVSQYSEEVDRAKKNALRNLLMVIQDDFDVDLSNPDALADFFNTMRMEDPDFADYIEYVFNFLESFNEEDVEDLSQISGISPAEMQSMSGLEEGMMPAEMPSETGLAEGMMPAEMPVEMQEEMSQVPVSPASPII